MKGIWENGTTAKAAALVALFKSNGLAAELREVASHLKTIPTTIEALDELIEKNVEAALKEYAKDAMTFITDTPGIYEVHLWCYAKDPVATITVDIRDELNELADYLETENVDDEWTDTQRKKAAAWADELEKLVIRLRGPRSGQAAVM